MGKGINKMATKLSMKLLYDRDSKKVLFAEAGKDVVDFLFYILSLPLATVISLLFDSNRPMVGCLGNLYKSVEILDSTFILKGQDKNSLLKPTTSISQAHLLLPDISVPTPSSDNVVKLYICSNSSCSHKDYYVKNPQLTCRWCSKYMNVLDVSNENKAVNETMNSKDGGFVKDMTTFMILDNLEIKPMSTISGICLLNQFNVKDVRNLQEKMVDFGMDEGLKILEASLKGKEVLTTVFIK